jgi:hypothetical protein
LTQNFGPNDSVYAAASYRILREESAGAAMAQTNDNNTFEPSMGITYWFNPDWGAQLDLVYSDRIYENRNDRRQYDATTRINRRFSRTLNGFVSYRYTYLDYNDDTQNSDLTVMLPTVGVTYQLEQNTLITIGAGYYFQTFDDPLIEDQDGPIVDAQIFKTIPFRRARIDMIARSGYTINDQGVEDLNLNIFYLGDVTASYSFSPRFSGNIRGSYRYDNFPNTIPERTDMTIDAGAGIIYQALSWMTLDLTYSYTDVTSDDATLEYAENRVMLRVNLMPASPFSLN